ncbi:MAG TPA: single-stranded DNA-binding protein [Flavobacterium sp.]|nr:single-stranded DNA-binding protein [Flavobacterium sp.]
MNSINLVGRLTKTPHLEYSPEGKAKGYFTLAVRRSFAKEGYQDTDFVFIRVLGKTAENCANFLDKGKMAGVTGELRIDNTEKDGVKGQFVYVFANNVEFLSPKDSGNSLGADTDISVEGIF